MREGDDGVSTTSLTSGETASTYYLGVFVIDSVVDLDAIMDPGQSARTAGLLASRGFKVRSRAKTDESAGAYIDSHEVLTDGSESSVVIEGVGYRNACTVMIGKLGVCALRFDSEEPYSRETETVLRSSSEDLLRSISLVLREKEHAGFSAQRPDHLLPGSSILWWHRVINVDSVPNEVLTAGLVAESQSGGVVAELSSNVTAGVGDGFTLVRGLNDCVYRPKMLEQVLRGLYTATEDWLLADTTNREMRVFLEASRRGTKEAAQGPIADMATDLVRHGHFLELYLDDRDRHLTVDRRLVWEAARDAWGLTGELATLGSRVRGVAEVLALLDARKREQRDRRRNAVLFAIALVTVLQGLLLFFDFAVADDLVIDHPLRAVLAVSLTIVGVGLIVLFALEAKIRRQSRWHSDSPFRL